MKGQKQAVVDYVLGCLPLFQKGKDIALMQLTKDQLESIKFSVAEDIALGRVEYGKDPHNRAEVTAYARSMVMNHLKKAKELNGGVTYGKTTAQVATLTKNKALSDIDMEVLPEDLSEFVKTLV
jgi:hypothetical protein